jgi:hypothetical protein
MEPPCLEAETGPLIRCGRELVEVALTADGKSRKMCCVERFEREEGKN